MDMPWDQNDPSMELQRASDIQLDVGDRRPQEYNLCKCGNRKEKRSKTCVPCYHERLREEAKAKS